MNDWRSGVAKKRTKDSWNWLFHWKVLIDDKENICEQRKLKLKKINKINAKYK
jgi:hypothetical protein